MCPHEHTLLRFANGALSPVESSTVAAHVESCTSCRALIGRAGSAAPASASSLGVAALDAPEIGATFGDQYRLTRFLGKGGMGAVYEGAGPRGERVAIKVLLGATIAAGQDQLEMSGRFAREAAVATALEHDNIVPCLATGVDEATRLRYIVMPLLVGADLRTTIKRLAPLHPTVAVRIALQACRALAHAHEQGVVHRDIKPGNIFLEYDLAGDVTVKLLDFGIAKWAQDDHALTRSGSLLGTPHYTSPEQLRDSSSVDARADVWSLAAMLYRMLAGKLPYQKHRTVADLYLAILTDPAKPIQDVAPWIGPGLASVVHGALIQERDGRCPSIAEFARALRAFAGGSNELTATMLESVPATLRAKVAPRAELPAAWPPAALTHGSSDIIALEKGARDPLLGRRLGGKFHILRPLGHGGMASIYEAELDDGERCAIKVLSLRNEMDAQDAKRRFTREVKALSTLRNRHIVDVLEAGTDPETHEPYMAMELLRGDDLSAHIRRDGPLDPVACARLFVQACEGLQVAHDAGLVHRDVKPANLFVSEQPSGELVLKVVDFGLVKRFEVDEDGETTAALTQVGGVLGSPMYMSPEQAKHEPLDHRSDVWSLGIALYHALAGTVPWGKRGSVAELIVAICTERVPDVREHAPWVPAPLAEALARALERDPQKRTASVRDFGQAIHAVCDGSFTVHARDLKSVSTAVKNNAEPLADDALTRSVTHHTATRPVEPAKKRGGLMAAALLFGVGAVVAAVVITRQKPEAVAAPASATPRATVAPTATAALPAPMKVTVRIVPPDAKVFVDDKPTPATDGTLTLDARGGDSFEVRVVQDGRETKRTVVVTREGRAVPASVELAAPAPSATPSATAAPRPQVRPVPRVPVPKPRGIARDNW